MDLVQDWIHHTERSHLSRLAVKYRSYLQYNKIKATEHQQVDAAGRPDSFHAKKIYKYKNLPFHVLSDINSSIKLLKNHFSCLNLSFINHTELWQKKKCQLQIYNIWQQMKFLKQIRCRILICRVNANVTESTSDHENIDSVRNKQGLHLQSGKVHYISSHSYIAQ